jgi:hypothetical protein
MKNNVAVCNIMQIFRDTYEVFAYNPIGKKISHYS